MLSCLLEGLMHCGWSPDAFEGNAKRAAHEYALTLKKNLYRIPCNAKSAIVGYLWSAWHLAEKTEGIRVCAAPLQSMQKIEWRLEGAGWHYIVEKTVIPPLFYFLSHSNNRIPHPVSSMFNDTSIGLFVTLNGDALFPEVLIESERIIRIKKNGYRFRHHCATASLRNIVWTTVIFVFQQTFYRLDILTLPNTVENIIVQCDLILEIPKQPPRIPSAKPQVEFIENPLQVAFQNFVQGDKALLSSPSLSVKTSAPLRQSVAWSFDPKATSIDRTHLLGIYD